MGILYKSRDVLSKPCLKQLYFSFIHSYVNYANIAWVSTSKSKLERLYRCQKHAARAIYHKDRYTHASPLLNDTKALNVFKLNIFNILCFMYKCKQNLNPPVFHNVFTHRTKTKYALRNEYSILYSGTSMSNKFQSVLHFIIKKRAQGSSYFCICCFIKFR